MRRIIRVLKVVDTREFEEGSDDRVRPIPGSGRLNVCTRCGREHEVHAEVLLDDNTHAIVGTGCGRKENSELAAKFTKAENLAKRLARLNAKQRAFSRLTDSWDQANAAVLAMPQPGVTWSLVSGSSRFEVRVGDGRAFASNPQTLSPNDRDEREDCARSNWRANRMAELGQPRWRPQPPLDFDRKRTQILKAMASVGVEAAG